MSSSSSGRQAGTIFLFSNCDTKIYIGHVLLFGPGCIDESAVKKLKKGGVNIIAISVFVSLHGHHYKRKLKFSKGTKFFIKNGVVQKKTKDGQKKWIVQRNKKIIIF